MNELLHWKNEFLFFLDVFITMGCLLLCVKKGKESMTAFIVLCTVLANLFVPKQIVLFGMNVTSSDFLAVGVILGMNLLQEFYGKESAKRALNFSFIGMGFFAVVSRIHLLFSPSAMDSTHSAFCEILSSSLRLLSASLITFFIVQQVDIRFYAFLKRRLSERSLVRRIGTSLFFSQALDTVLFTFLGLWGVLSHLFDIMIFSYGIKVICILLFSPLSLLCYRLKIFNHNKEGNYVNPINSP